MAEKLYRLYCEMCNWNRYTDGTDIQDLIEYKRCVVQTGVPKMDPVTKKITAKKPISLPKQFRCPKCGRLVTVRKVIEPPPVATEEEIKDENINSGSQESNGGPEVSPGPPANP